jgi:hypothetical protein
MSRWFPKVEDFESDTPEVKAERMETLKAELKTELAETKLVTDKNNNTFKIKQTKVAPDADYSTEDRVRDIALQRAKLWEYQEKKPDEQRDIVIETEDFTLQDRLRRTALTDARMELHAMPSRDPLEKEEVRETPFNMRGFNEERRFFDSLGQRDAHEPETTRPLPAAVVARLAPVESIPIPEDKHTTAFKAVFRNLMGIPAQKQKSESEMKKYDVDGIVRSIVDSGYTKSWTAPDVQRTIKPDAVAYTVGRRALEAVHAAKTMPELKTLSVKERDELILSIGRTMLNVSMTGPTASRIGARITENAPLVHDSIRKKILATIDPEIMKKSLGPEWIQISQRNNVVNATVRNPTGEKAKLVPLVQDPKAGIPVGSRTLAPSHAAAVAPERPVTSLKDELTKIWRDPYV